MPENPQTPAHSAVRSQPILNSQPPPSIPDHELLRCIGRGSYGEVWLARNVLGDFRAVKVVYRNRFEHERPYEREFEGVRKFEPISRRHDSQVDILHVGRNDETGYFYYVMELADSVPGSEFRVSSSPGERQPGTPNPKPETYVPKTLRAEQLRRARLPVDECLTIGLALTTAVQHLHEHGLVHRDIKPSNIIFVGGVPKLADIGLVASMDQTMSFVGTSGYLPPEGPGTPPADLYSLGKVLYEISTGRDRTDFPKLPPELLEVAAGVSPGGPGVQVSERVEQGQPNPGGKMPPSTAGGTPAATALLELNAVILKACAHDPRQRYQSAQEMAADLALLQRGQSVKRRQRVEKRVVRARRLLVPTLLLTLLVAGGGYWIRSSRNPTQRQSPVDPVRRAAAQKLYEQAKTYPRNTRDGITKATELLNQAILADPDFAKPYAYLAQVYLEAAGWHLPPRLALTEAKKNAVRALALDDTLAQAHLSLAQVLFQLERDATGAEAKFRRTIELQPTNAWSYSWYGGMLTVLGRFEEADALLKRAQELDPTAQVVLTGVGWRYYRERRFTEALAPAVKVRTLYPDDPVAHQLYASVQERLKNYPEALAAAHRARQLDSVPDLIALVGFVHARAGRRTETEKTLTELNAIAEARYVSPVYAAWIYAGLGDVDKVVELLQKAHEEVPLHPALLQTEPKWDEVRDDPRFIALLQKIRLEK